MPSQLMKHILRALQEMRQIVVGCRLGEVKNTIALIGFALVTPVLFTCCSPTAHDVARLPNPAPTSEPKAGQSPRSTPTESEPSATTGNSRQTGEGFAKIAEGMNSRQAERDRIAREREACEGEMAKGLRNDPALQQRLAALTTRQRELKLALAVDESCLGLDRALAVSLDLDPANLGELAGRFDRFQNQLDAYGKQLEATRRECEEAAGQLGQTNPEVVRARTVLSILETAWRPVRDRMFAAEEMASRKEPGDEEKTKKALLDLKQRPRATEAKP